MIDQTVWLAPKATSYVVVCEECAASTAISGRRWKAGSSSSAGTRPSSARAATRSASSARTASLSACAPS